MNDKQTVSLSEDDLLELQRILTDRDEAAALAFLREVIWHRVKAGRRKMINPKLGSGSQG